MQKFRDVDPRELRFPSSRRFVDAGKFARQLSRYGRSLQGMPTLEVEEASDGVLVVVDGVTRATRAAKMAPGQLVRVEIIAYRKQPAAGDPKIGDHLP